MDNLQPSGLADYLRTTAKSHNEVQPNKRDRFGKINSNVVAKRMSPA
ncbi:hypothetical protein ACIQUS_10775 [Pseudomonas sp. NPDC090755]